MTPESAPMAEPTAEAKRVARESFDKAREIVASKSGNFDYVFKLLQTACKLDPAHLPYRQALRKAQKAKVGDGKVGWLAAKSMVVTRTRLKNAARANEHARVLELGEEILCVDPWDHGAQYDMGEAAAALGLVEVAIYVLDQARQKYPKDAPLNRLLARQCEKLGKFTHAAALWNLVKEADPSDQEATHKAKDLAASETIQRGGYADGSGKLTSREMTALPSDPVEREAAPFKSRVEANPADAPAHLSLAGVYRRHGKHEEAKAVLVNGLAATGQNVRLQNELMELEIEPFRQDLERASARLAEVLARPELLDADPDAPSPAEIEGRIRALKKEILQRELEIHRARAERTPAEAQHRVEIGDRLFQLERIDEAIAELQPARKDPRYGVRALTLLGHCFRRRNNWRLAQRNYEEALAQLTSAEEDQKKDVLFSLAEGHAQAGDLKTAIDYGHELANIDFGYRDIGKFLDEWEAARG